MIPERLFLLLIIILQLLEVQAQAHVSSSLFHVSSMHIYHYPFGTPLSSHSHIYYISSVSRSYFNACTALVGNNIVGVEIEMKTNKELCQLAEKTHNSHLMHQLIVNQMHVHCYLKEYLSCTKLAEEHHI